MHVKGKKLSGPTSRREMSEEKKMEKMKTGKDERKFLNIWPKFLRMFNKFGN